MNVILSYLEQSLLLDLALILGSLYLVLRLMAPAIPVISPGDLVPSYKRFERREELYGDRRHDAGIAFTGLDRRLHERRVAA